MSTSSNQHPGNQYLLEIGTEELPVSFLLSAPTELSDKVKAALSEAGLEQGSAYGNVTVYATPRRMALLISGLPEEQPPRTFKTKGPPIRVALDADGKPTPAGQGFARKLGVEFSELLQERISDDQGEGETYMVLNRTEAGRPLGTLLAELLPELVLGLSGSHFMAWGSNTERFSRPIRWLVSLWNDTHLPVTIGPVASGTTSQGHRVLSADPVPISSASQYLETLEKEGFVLADQARRRELIWHQLQDAAKKAGGDVRPNDDLLDTVTMLVEHPSIVTGRFKEAFLEIPDTVITTVMAAHQKYFPVHQASALQPCFLTVSNGREESADIIRHGNEKVLTARLEDARFFYLEDRKIPLEDRLEKLKGITFQKGLGSMYAKALRLEKLSGLIADQYAATLQLVADGPNHVRRAARLAKADLVTGMVFEFTELQGVMGRRYAQLGNEPDAVAEAIYEHYLPRFNGDAVATTPVGIAVSLADKIDTMAAVFSQKNAKLPSGSKDPLGLRRMASGMILTILENKLSLDLLPLMAEAYREIVASIPAPEPKPGKKAEPFFQDEATTLELVSTFVLQRFRGLLLEQGNRYDIVDAVLEAGRNPLSDLGDVITRLACLKTLTADESALKTVYEPANRIFKILGEQYNAASTTADVQAPLLKDPAEQALYEALRTLESQGFLSAERTAARYTALVSALTAMGQAIEQFFDKVMVNDPDPAVRENRYNLLSVLNRHTLQLACFPKLVV